MTLVKENFFLDTSALFKRYVPEKGSDVVDGLFELDTPLFISSVTLCEVVSNFRRLVDVDKIITEKEFKILKAAFLGEIGDGLLELVELTTSIFLDSLEIISKKYVTPLDSIQLAAALSLPERPVFVCSDLKLASLAKDYGLSIIEP